MTCGGGLRCHMGMFFYYLVLSVGVDGSAMNTFKSTEAYQCLHSGKVGRVLHSKNEKEEYLFFESCSQPQSVQHTKTTSILFQRHDSFCFRRV
ncbi:unnamed protein product [Arctogadus glacialis]